MITFLDFPIYLMETLNCWGSLCGYLLFMFLTTISKGSACEAPSSPECFRKTVNESVYICEWSMNTTESNVKFDLYFNETTSFRGIKTSQLEITNERLIRSRPVNIWVEAHVGNSSCTSPRRSVKLGLIVKYEAPHNISLSWQKNNLSLTWKAAENYPSLVEVWFRQLGRPTESWEKRLLKADMLTAHSSPAVPASHCATVKRKVTPEYRVLLVNLLKHSAYQVQLRQRSTQAQMPLWSKWSPVVTVPAELEHEPEVTMTTKLLNGTREVTLTWKPVLHAATLGGVTYTVEVIQSSHRCPCARRERRRHHVRTYMYTTYVLYSPVNISVIATNAASCSSAALIQVPAELGKNLKLCDKKALDEKLNKKTCKQWYEIPDQDSRPGNVITLASKRIKERQRVKKRMKNYVRYLHFEHRCDGGKPKTVKMCLFYLKEGAPQRAPQDFTTSGETHKSSELSWKGIAFRDQRGFLTHYSLCIVKISSEEEPKAEWRNISASLIKYHLENLTPGAKYNISLAGVTGGGEGPKARLTLNMLPEKPANVWLSLGLLVIFFLSSSTCTFILKRFRIKNKIFPPVPTPVIQDFNPCQLEPSQEILEKKEEVDELMLLYPESNSVPEDVGDDGSDRNMENEGGDSRMSGENGDEGPGSTDQALRSSREEEITDLEQLDNEIAILIYRNGLVFDMKTDSP